MLQRKCMYCFYNLQKENLFIKIGEDIVDLHDAEANLFAAEFVE